ncbi:uracil-DNA glycosylase [Candidatus Berkelbacteria bacterium]|nr:uracil-DNA glycosylase [Candidatus Berkelbacteria bacterium]
MVSFTSLDPPSLSAPAGQAPAGEESAANPTSSHFESLEAVAKAIEACTCSLCKERTKPVMGEGNPEAEVMLIGEAPGFNEDKQGRPFVGAAGQFLDELLASIGLKRTDVFITNMVHARPPGNRDPLPEELDASWPYLKAQIELVAPKLIVTLGRHSKGKFLPDTDSISRIHGQAFKRKNPADEVDSPADRQPHSASGFDGAQWYVALYHPAAGLHKQELKETIIKDFQTIKKVLTVVRAESLVLSQIENRKTQSVS